MKLADLLRDPERRRFAAAPEMDALVEPDALQEAYLVELRLDAADGASAWLLFDCRGALQITEGNTAIIHARHVSELCWKGPGRKGWIQWTVLSSTPEVSNGAWSLRLSLWPDADLTISADAAEFWVGDVPGGDEAPPDFNADDDPTIRAGLASFDSDFEPVHAVFLEPLQK